MAPRIVISGLGFATPLGMTPAEVWPEVVAGTSSFRPVTRFSTSDLRSHLAGEVDEERIAAYLPSQRFRRLPRLDQMIGAAFRLCLEDLKFGAVHRPQPHRIGVFLGTTRGPLECVEPISLTLARGRPRDVDPLKFQQTVLNAPLGHLSLHYRITGPCVCFANGNTSVFNALEAARVALEEGSVDVAFVGGGDSLTEGYYRALIDLRMLSPQNGGIEGAAPFNRHRNGLSVSEGSVFVAVEREDTCRARGGAVRAVLEGLALVADGYSYYGNDPQGSGFTRCLSEALSEAGRSARDVDVLIAAASGSPVLDLAELRALSRAWGGELDRLAVVAPKARFGDIGSASGAMALALAVMILELGIVPPTPEAHPIEPSFAIDIPNGAVQRSCRRALVQEVAWGGLNAAVLLAAGEA